jgi:hypothetical protein
MQSPDGGHLASPGVGSAYKDYSTLEVVPSSEYEKEVVHLPNTPFQDANSKYLAIPPTSQSGTAWSGDAVGAGARTKILGLKRRTFFIVAWATSLLIAIAVGLGAGLGATIGSRSADTGVTTTGAGASVPGGITTPPAQSVTSTGATSASRTTSRPDGDTAAPSTSLPAPTLPNAPSPSIASTTPPSASSAPPPQSSAALKIGGVGGRCSNNWGGDCICLDEGVCRNKWKGTPYTGMPGNYPCPNDPSNIMACVVSPCLGKAKPAQCLWKETCNQLSPGMLGAPPHRPALLGQFC